MYGDFSSDRIVTGGIVGGSGSSELSKLLQGRTLWISMLVSYLILIAGILMRLLLFRAR